MRLDHERAERWFRGDAIRSGPKTGNRRRCAGPAKRVGWGASTNLNRNKWDMTQQGYVTAPHETHSQSYFGMALEWKATGARTAGALALVEVHGTRRNVPPMHYHESADKFFYVLQGEMTFKVDTEVKRIGHGGFVWIPRTVIHGFAVHGESARFLFGFVPAGLKRMFEEISTSEDQPAPRASTNPPSTLAINAHRGKHGTIVVGPPLRAQLPLV